MLPGRTPFHRENGFSQLTVLFHNVIPHKHQSINYIKPFNMPGVLKKNKATPSA